MKTKFKISDIKYEEFNDKNRLTIINSTYMRQYNGSYIDYIIAYEEYGVKAKSHAKKLKVNDIVEIEYIPKSFNVNNNYNTVLIISDLKIIKTEKEPLLNLL